MHLIYDTKTSSINRLYAAKLLSNLAVESKSVGEEKQLLFEHESISI